MSANSVPKVTTNSGKAVCDSNVFLHLDLICFNLRGILPNRAYLHHLCSNYKAIICLSEHWLHLTLSLIFIRITYMISNVFLIAKIVISVSHAILEVTEVLPSYGIAPSIMW